MANTLCNTCTHLKKNGFRNHTNPDGSLRTDIYFWCTAMNISMFNLVPHSGHCNHFNISETATPAQKYESISR